MITRMLGFFPDPLGVGSAALAAFVRKKVRTAAQKANILDRNVVFMFRGNSETSRSRRKWDLRLTGIAGSIAL